MRKSKFLLLAMLGLLGCKGMSEPEPDPNAVRLEMCATDYDVSCMKAEETSTSDGALEVLGTLKDAVVNTAGEPVSDLEEDQYGDLTRDSYLEHYTHLASEQDQVMLNGILRKLLAVRPNPSDLDYNIYLIRDGQINAFTVGGEIFVTTALLKSAQSKDELACIIGHEIGHNELGHIEGIIRQDRVAQGLLGEELAASVSGLLQAATAGFGQKGEVQADFYGIDLALAAGYNACRGIDFDARMAQYDGEASEWDNFLRSHPYSARRAECQRAHLSSLHRLNCDIK